MNDTLFMFVIASLIAAVFIFAVVRGFTDAKVHTGGSRIKGGARPLTIRGRTLLIGARERPLDGVQAEAVADGKHRISATRVVVGTLIDPGLGTLVGAVAAKHETLLVITGPDWSETVVFKDLGRATLAAHQINDAVTRFV